MSLFEILKKLLWIPIGFTGLLIGLLIGIIVGTLAMVFFLLSQLSAIPLEYVTVLITTTMALSTVILAIITGWYAISTHRILDEQRKLRQISDFEKQLEKLYYPLIDILKNPRVMHFTGGEKGYFIELKKIDEIIPFQHLASVEVKGLIENFIKIAFEERTIVMGDMDDVTNFDIVDESFTKKLEVEIGRLKKELQQIKNS